MFRGYVSFREGTSSNSGCMWMFYRYLLFSKLTTLDEVQETSRSQKIKIFILNDSCRKKTIEMWAELPSEHVWDSGHPKTCPLVRF